MPMLRAGPFDAGVLVMLIPIVAIVCGTVLKMAKLKSSEGAGPALNELTARCEALEQDVGMLRQELSETQERLDFTERLLAAPRDSKPPT